MAEHCADRSPAVSRVIDYLIAPCFAAVTNAVITRSCECLLGLTTRQRQARRIRPAAGSASMARTSHFLGRQFLELWDMVRCPACGSPGWKH